MTIGQIVRSQVLLHGAGAKGTRGHKVSMRVADLVFSLALALALAIGAAAPALAMDAPQTRWSRLWGQGALDTMPVVVQALIPRMCMRIFRLSSRMFFDFVHWRAGAPTFPTFRA